MLFFTNHQSGCNGGAKARKKYNAEHCAAAMITSKDGLNTQQEYSAEDCGETMVTWNNGQKANGNKAQKIMEQPWLRAKTDWKQNRNIVQGTVELPWLWAKTGWKPNGNTAQGNTLGRNGITILRSERAKGMGRIANELLPAALSERKLLSSLTPRVLPWAIFLLGLRPVFA